MDLSKLPKLSVSPAPPPSNVPAANEVTTYPNRAPVNSMDMGIDLILSLIVGLIFVMLGSPFGGWLISSLRGVPYDTGVTWTSGPDAGKTVEFFELQGGSGWLYMGEWVLGICLLIEALLITLAIVRNNWARKLIILAMLLGIIGALANIVAIIQQVRMGFTQPIFSLVGVLIGAMMAFAHARHLSSPSR